MSRRLIKIIILVTLIVLVDQALKIWVKTHMVYGDHMQILGLDWAYIHFVENNGMAFGIVLGGEMGKLILSLFRIVAVGFLIYYIRFLHRTRASFGLLVSFALILAGAIGNIIDSAFYGLLFSESYPAGHIAQFFPPDGGYAKFLHGRVVDMFYFPVFQMSGNYPAWIPVLGGKAYAFEFFKPVFNVADMSITFGVLNILIFQRDFFNGHPEETAAIKQETPVADLTEATTDKELEVSEEETEEESVNPDDTTDEEKK